MIPNRHSSGNKETVGEMTFRGQKLLKGCLIESAWFAARLDPAMNMCVNHSCKGMEPNKAIIKIARKLVNRIAYVLKNEKEYVSGVV
jgi:transposase